MYHAILGVVKAGEKALVFLFAVNTTLPILFYRMAFL